MRNNIGRGYFIKDIDTLNEYLEVFSETVDIYIPKDMKKKSELNREPLEGDIIGTIDGKDILLIKVFYSDNKGSQAELLHGSRIKIRKEEVENFGVIKNSADESKIDELIDRYFADKT